MPLSEQEQRLLDEMERSLYHNDTDFVSAVSGRGRLHYGSLVLGILVGLAGLAVIIVGVAIQQPLVGILGFAGMFAGVLLSLRRTGPASHTARSRPSASKSGPARGSSFMDRMNDRWESREDREN